jgi:hypothetical protein
MRESIGKQELLECLCVSNGDQAKGRFPVVISTQPCEITEPKRGFVLQLAVITHDAQQPNRRFPKLNEPLHPGVVNDSGQIERIK